MAEGAEADIPLLDRLKDDGTLKATRLLCGL